MEDEAAPRDVSIRQEPIELAQFLKFAGVAGTGGGAKLAVVNGLVEVNGAVERRKGRKLRAGDTVRSGGETLVVRLGASPGAGPKGPR
jgi:ribosome-associated protein